MTIKLYGFGNSPNVRKVSLLAAALDIPLTHVTLDLNNREFHSPDYLAKNPNGKVPTIDDDGFVLWESAAILRYLAAKRPERGLVPSDPFERARLDQWLFWWTAHLEPALDRLVYERRVKPFLGRPDVDPSILAEAEATLDRFLPILDGQLAGKEYILGKLSVVDFAVSPRLDGVSTLLKVDLDRYPNVTAWLAGRYAGKAVLERRIGLSAYLPALIEKREPLGRRRRLLERVLSGRSDANIPFEQTRTLLSSLGFSERVRGSHHVFWREGIAKRINLQPAREGTCKPYQVRQMRETLLEYGEELGI